MNGLLPKVSVIIPFYNCPYVNEAIQSALDQSYSNIEIIVVDDGSTYYTYKLIPFNDRVIYFRTDNRGTASALNHGIRLATGQYVAWLSSDDLFHPDKIARQLSFMLANDAWVSHTNYDLVNALNETIQTSAGRTYSSMLEFRRAFLASVPVHGCTVMAKKELFTHVGYFNEHLLYTQDYEMWMRIALSPFDFQYLQESLTRFRWHGGNGTILHQAGMEKEVRCIRETYNPLLLSRLEKDVSG